MAVYECEHEIVKHEMCSIEQKKGTNMGKRIKCTIVKPLENSKYLQRSQKGLQ